MNIRQITSAISYVGVNERSKPLFENLWPLPGGMSYNSYLVKGTEGVALIDTAPVSTLEQYFANIQSIIGATPVSYLIVNHMEPDHSGLMPAIYQRYPGIRIVVNKVSLPMAKGFAPCIPDEAYLVVADGETLSLGNLSLQFHTIPMVHWPETMATWVAEEKVLFTCDALGCYGALPGGVIDTEMCTERFLPEMERYYATIVARYAPFVQKALAKIATLPKPEYVCPSHGPVWHERIDDVIEVYNRLSLGRGEDGIVIIYGSMYGNTARLADEIASALTAEGFKKIIVHDLASADLSVVIRDIVKYKGLIVGSPTYNNSLYPPVKHILEAIKIREVKNRVFGFFSGYTWAPMAQKLLEQFATDMKYDVSARVTIAQGGDSTVPEKVKQFAADFHARYRDASH